MDFQPKALTGMFAALNERRLHTISDHSSLDIFSKAKGTQAFDAQLKKDIADLPPFLKKLLSEFDITFQTGRTAKDVDPRAAFEKGRGFAGSTLDEKAAGIFLSDKKVIGVYKDKISSDPSAIGRVAYHEIGHAIDKFLGYPSASNLLFIAAYERDLKKYKDQGRLLAKEYGINPDKIDSYTDDQLMSEGVAVPSSFRNIVKGKVAGVLSAEYFTDSSMGGTQEDDKSARSETFAELIALSLLKRTGKLQENDPFLKIFPQAAEQVNKIMGGLEAYYTLAPRPIAPNVSLAPPN